MLWPPWGIGEEGRGSEICWGWEFAFFLLLVASLPSIEGPLKIPPLFFSPPPASTVSSTSVKKPKQNRENHVTCLMCVMLYSPWAPQFRWLLQDHGGWCLPGTAIHPTCNPPCRVRAAPWLRVWCRDLPGWPWRVSCAPLSFRRLCFWSGAFLPLGEDFPPQRKQGWGLAG